MTEASDEDVRPAQGFVPICAIGASAGGVTALQNLFRQVPTELGLAYVVILHLAPDQPSALSEILAVCTRMPVFQVEDSPTLKPNCVFVIPPNRELVIAGDSVSAQPFSEPRGQRAPVDGFFRSIAAARGDGIAMVLSGAGADGAVGVRAIKEAGGVVMVQDPGEAGFASMPQNAIASGVADFVAPIARLVERLQEVSQSKEAVRSLDMEGAANDLRRVIAFLRSHTGHDFASYKRATVMRRVTRRMQVCRTNTLAAYVDYLYTTPEEAHLLFADLLISVTSFFRDPRSFEALAQSAVQPLFDGLDPDSEEGLRIWSVGCATGEEAYSVAILFLEEAERRKWRVPIQVFATDLDEGALATAREARYPRTIEADVSEERLSKFFVDEGTHFRIRKEVRDAVLFATHSVLKEPPFMRLDLISCRNLLIYLERSMQQQVAAIFHYGLRTGRYLFLGSAETADVAAERFAPLDRDARLYVARPHSPNLLPILPQFAIPERRVGSSHTSSTPRAIGHTGPAELHAAALERTAPPSALVDDTGNILHLSPTAGRFILHSAGPISNILPAVVRPELRLDLKLALARAVEQRLSTLTHQVTVAFDGETRRVAMYVMPASDAGAEVQALVQFLDNGTVADADLPAAEPEAQPDEVRRLHAELKRSQEALVASRNGHEVAIQELRAANEELQSMNEEYRSTAEELETSKEELQSINEELHTVNAELKSKLESISVAHSDLQNLTAATEVGTLFLDPDLRIKMFTPPIVDLFNVAPTDIGRVITDFTHQLAYDGIEDDVRRVLNTLASFEREVMSKRGRWFVMRLRPYRTVDARIDGTVVTFVDITRRLETERSLSRSEQQLRALVRASSQVLYRMSPTWNEMRELFGGGLLSNTEEPSQSWLDHYIPADEQEHIRAVVQQAIDARSIFELEHRVRRADGTIGWVHSRAIPILDGSGTITEWFGSAADVTLRRRAENALRNSEERMRVLIEGMPQLVWRAVDSGKWTWSSPQWTAYTHLSDHDSRDHKWLAAIHPDDRDRTMTAWHEAARTRVLELEYRVCNVETRQYRWFQSRATPLLDAQGRVIEWLGTSTDVDDLRQLQESQSVMVAELQHRTRNLIAVVRSVANQTMARVETLDGFRDAFGDRLSALSRVQGLLSRSDQEPITIGALVRSEIEALGTVTQPNRVTLAGPDVSLRNATVQTLALALHELATNAVKYGALASDTGRLTVTWTRYHVEGDGVWLAITWVEEGSPARRGGSPRPGGGYGRELIERALPYALKAKTRYELGDDGVRCTIDLPMSGTVRLSDGRPAPSGTPGGAVPS